MSIYNDIQKATQIPQSGKEVAFVLKEVQDTPRRQMRKLATPKNEGLYDDIRNNFSEENNYTFQDFCKTEKELVSAIKEANCGISYSNENIEEQWKARRMKACMNSTNGHLSTDKSSDSQENSTAKLLDIDVSIGKNGIRDSVARKSQCHENTVSGEPLKDLAIRNKSKTVEDMNNETKQQNNVSPQDEQSNLSLVQCPDEPEVLVHPLMVSGTVDDSVHRNIDFTVPRIGKVNRVTSTQYYIHMDDPDFSFVKNVRKSNEH